MCLARTGTGTSGTLVTRVVAAALARPCGNRNLWDKLADTIGSNIAPSPQDASPRVFLSPVARARWGGCSAPPAAPCTWLAARGPGKQDVEGSRVGLARRGGGCAIKTSHAGEEDKQTPASSAPEGEREPRRWGWRGGGADVRERGVSAPGSLFPSRGWGEPGARPHPAGDGGAGAGGCPKGPPAPSCPVPPGAARHLPALCLPAPRCLSLLTGAKNKPGERSSRRLPAGDGSGGPRAVGRAGTASIPQTHASPVRRGKRPFGSFQPGMVLISAR